MSLSPPLQPLMHVNAQDISKLSRRPTQNYSTYMAVCSRANTRAFQFFLKNKFGFFSFLKGSGIYG